MICNVYGQYRKYWRLFASKDYFDEEGMFYSFMISFPLLFITIFQIVCSYSWCLYVVCATVVHDQNTCRTAQVSED